MNPDLELLTRISDAIETKDFFASAWNDSFDDWNLVKDAGEFLVRLDLEEIMGHALLARAHKHLGNLDHARNELTKCQIQIENGRLNPAEGEMLLRLLAHEESVLSTRGISPETDEAL
jgi:hypothetical protein